MHVRVTLAALAVAALAGLTAAEDWPGWRGPRHDGTVSDTGYPLTWTGTENVRWKTNLPGTGHSSPIISKGKIFVTGCVEAEQRRVLYCVDRKTGTIEWERTVLTSPLEKKHGENSYASSTPAADGERVYVTFFDAPQLRVYCYDYAGKKLWEKNPGEFKSVHGFCSPPTLHNDKVIVNGDQDAKAYIVAFDKLTGEERWRADRPNRTRSYCPPVVFDAAGKKQLVLTGSKSVASYDPDTGARHWVLDGPTEQFVSSVVMHDGLFLLTAGFPEHWVMAIKPDGTGNITNTPYVAWAKNKQGGYVPSPVAHDHKLYCVDDKGIAGCYDVKTGVRHWNERLSFSKHHASAVVADGRVYFAADDGITYVVKAQMRSRPGGKVPHAEREEYTRHPRPGNHRVPPQDRRNTEAGTKGSQTPRQAIRDTIRRLSTASRQISPTCPVALGRAEVSSIPTTACGEQALRDAGKPGRARGVTTFAPTSPGCRPRRPPRS